MDRARIEQVRRFNRRVTQRLAALDDRHLARNRPLAEARVLCEIGPDGCEVRTLRTRLGLDSDRASHLLRSLKADGLIELTADGPDRRVRTARLTPAGLAERESLGQAGEALAESLLSRLSERQQMRLVGAMAEVERLLTAAMVDLRPVDPAHPDARQCIRAYTAELNRRSGSGRDPANGLPADPHELRPPEGLLVVASLHSEPVGCGAIRHQRDAPSEIERTWVAEPVRGLGLARRLLERLEAEAIRSGATATRVEINGALTEAIGLYRSAGYREVPASYDEPFANHWLQKELR